MLRNVHYIGKVRWNWRKTVTIVEDGEFLKTRPHNKIGEYLVFEGKHDGIVPLDLYNAAQERTGKNPRTKPEVKTHNVFAGLLYCSCGRSMIMQNKKNEPSRVVCPDQAHCKTRSCTYDILIERTIDVLKQCIEDFEIRIQNNESDSVKLHARLIKQLEAKAEELAKKEISQWEKYSEEAMPKHIFDALNEKVLKEKEEVRQALCKAYESMPEPVDYTEKVSTFSAALEALPDPDVDALKKNALLKACIDRITYHRERGERLAVKSTKFETGWSDTPIELDVKLKV
jgi:hypothetical protein